MKKLVIGLIVVIVLVGGAALLFLMNINAVVKQGIETAGPQILGTGVSVDQVDISFMSGTGSIRGLTVMNPQGYTEAPAIRLNELSVKLNPRSVTSDKIHIYEVLIDSPVIAYEGNLRDSNLQALQKAAAGGAGDAAPAEEEVSAGPSLMIDSLKMVNAELGVQLSFLGEPLALTLPELELKDIGKDGETSAADVMSQVLVALNDAILPLIKENAGGLGDQLKEKGEELKDKGEELKDKAKEGLDKLKNLFGG